MKAMRIAENVNEAELIRAVSRLISDITGVQLGEKQYALVQGRLGKRMRELQLPTPTAYARHFNENHGVEVGVLTSLLTTHHTYFFREFQHFEHLLKVTLPALVSGHASPLARSAGRGDRVGASVRISRGSEGGGEFRELANL